jgi:hypothetical protein
MELVPDDALDCLCFAADAVDQMNIIALLRHFATIFAVCDICVVQLLFRKTFNGTAFLPFC